MLATPKGYTATDIYCRFLRMKGYQVLHPMGFDSFGLPAENYAIKTGTHPKATTEQNIDRFRVQIKALGFSYDWDREVATHTPEYYKMDPMDLPQAFRKGPRLRGQGSHQLVPLLQDRPRQRGSKRRLLRPL